MALTTLNVRLAAGGWTASTLSTIASLSPVNEADGDNVQVWGSSTGAELTPQAATLVGTVVVSPSGSYATAPSVNLWNAFPYYWLAQTVGTTPGFQVNINGTP
jgi:hypothetical protein